MKKFHFFKKNNYSTNTQAFHYDKKTMIKCIVFWVLLVAIAWYIMTPSCNQWPWFNFLVDCDHCFVKDDFHNVLKQEWIIFFERNLI